MQQFGQRFLHLNSVALATASFQSGDCLRQLMAMESEHGKFSIYSTRRRMDNKIWRSVSFWHAWMN